jgi:2-amino-4-hydroxy-6-hydroxymethyldihydropteridine diphosphokinase
MISPPQWSGAVTIDALLSLGGNVGDRRATMDAAIERLAAIPGTTVTARSSYYRTAPDGPVVQDWFVNLAVAVTTELDPLALVAACRTIEHALGRDRATEIAWGPRPVDVDVIATGDQRTMTPAGGDLDCRPFVLVPLAEIAAGVRIGARTIDEYAAAAGNAGVERLDWPMAGAL